MAVLCVNGGECCGCGECQEHSCECCECGETWKIYEIDGEKMCRKCMMEYIKENFLSDILTQFESDIFEFLDVKEVIE